MNLKEGRPAIYAAGLPSFFCAFLIEKSSALDFTDEEQF